MLVNQEEELEVGSVQQRPNHLFRRARQRLGYSRQDLADAVNKLLPQYCMLTANDIGKIERGVVTYPRELRRAALRSILQAGVDADIGLMNVRRRPTDSDPINVQPRGSKERGGLVRIPVQLDGETIGQLVLQASAVEALPTTRFTFDTCGMAAQVERRSANAISNGRADGADRTLGAAVDGLDSFLTVTRLLASQRQSVAPDVLLALVEAHRDCLSALFRRASSDALRADIGALLGEASIVASRLWSAQGNRSMALAHCASARGLAEKLGNPALGATARIFESNLHSEAATLIGHDGDVMLGLRMLEEASTLAGSLGPAARARIAAEQAQAYAVLKLPNESEKALDRARSAVEDIQAGDRSGLFSDWNSGRLRVYEGTCRLLLGQPEEAVAVLSETSHDMESDHGNINVLLAARVDLASAYAESGEPELACDVLADAYEHLVGIGNHRGLNRAHRARERLDRWKMRQPVRELDQKLMRTAQAT